MLPDPNKDTYNLEWWADGHLIEVVFSRETSDGFAFVCEACEHKVWGAKYFPNRAMIKIYTACKDHPPERGEVPGSMILWWSDELERMPDALVQREYAVHLAYYLKETQNERDTLKAA